MEGDDPKPRLQPADSPLDRQVAKLGRESRELAERERRGQVSRRELLCQHPLISLKLRELSVQYRRNPRIREVWDTVEKRLLDARRNGVNGG